MGRINKKDNTPVACALFDRRELRTTRAKHTNLRAVGDCSSFAGGAKQNLIMRIFSYALLNLTCKCAAMWDSQNGFAEKCAVE
jgi:hypothetical protein